VVPAFASNATDLGLTCISTTLNRVVELALERAIAVNVAERVLSKEQQLQTSIFPSLSA
jgi:hypothetical protein